MARCLTCGGELTTGGCVTCDEVRYYVNGVRVSAFPVALAVPPAPVPLPPLDGPGSHAWDLREMQAQRARAEAAEARCADAEHQRALTEEARERTQREAHELAAELSAEIDRLRAERDAAREALRDLANAVVDYESAPADKGFTARSRMIAAAHAARGEKP